MNLDDDEIYRTAIAHYGEPAQVLKAIEEMAELIYELRWLFVTDDSDEYGFLSEIKKAAWTIRNIAKDEIDISKLEFDDEYEKSYKDIKSECADVENVLNQLRIMFGPWDDERKMKLDRLRERIDNNK